MADRRDESLNPQCEESVCVLNGGVKNKKNNFTPLSDTHTENIRQVPPIALEKQVESGLEFILGHLSGPQFPRKISTAISPGQKEVGYKDLAILHYQGALWQDCRISAFYPGQKNPDLVFIDLDAKDFCSERAFKAALTKILKCINRKIGGHPTVVWSGNGCHIIQPIDCPADLDNVKEFAALVRDRDVNKAFLQFASKYLSDYRRDKGNYPSLNSCLLRVPGSLNCKCKEQGTDPQVKIIQKWDGHRPDYRLLLGSFYAYLVGERERERIAAAHAAVLVAPHYGNGQAHEIAWIERLLLQTSIDDYRKHACNLIIVPYLVLRKGMTDIEQIEAIVMTWADRCAELRSLQPSRREFAKSVRSRVKKVMRNMIPPMSWSRLQRENPELAKKLSTGSSA
jgi:hypothetical protein